MDETINEACIDDSSDNIMKYANLANEPNELSENEVVELGDEESSEVELDRKAESVDEKEAPLDEEVEEPLDSTCEVQPLFEMDDWQDRVSKFATEYPMSREFFADIGDCILNDMNLWNDEACLEKAMLKVISKHYTPDSEKAQDEEFLANYIYNNEAIKGKIVEEYLDEIESSRLPRTMKRGGRIPLTIAKEPANIKEAGILAERLLRR